MFRFGFKIKIWNINDIGVIFDIMWMWFILMLCGLGYFVMFCSFIIFYIEDSIL